MVFLAYFLIITGLLIILSGIIGILIFPDLFYRVHASSKCATTGFATFILGLIIYTWRVDFIIKYLLVLVFIFITSPIVSHMIALSAVKNKVDFFRQRK